MNPHAIDLTMFQVIEERSGAMPFTMHDATGREVVRGNLNPGINAITIRSFKAGTYVLRTMCTAGEATQRFTILN